MSRAVLAFFLSGSMTLAVGPNALPAKPSSPFMGAYVHMPAVFDEAKDPDSCRRLIARSLDQFQASGLCMVMPYATTTGGAAMYASRIISNRPCADCDPLAVFIKEARKRAVWARIKIRPNARNARSYRAIPRDAARHGTAPNDRMGPEGHEHFAKSPAKTQIHEPGGAKSGALGAPSGPETGPADADLQDVLRAWPGLPEAVRARIVGIVRTAGERGKT